ncbi:MAG: hypothetical protein WC384_13165 [Prolixibacteraceae bacterium]|jgi:hypothetical protein
MKTYFFILIFGLFLNYGVKAQTLKIDKPDSSAIESIEPKKYQYPNNLKFPNPLAENQLKLQRPEMKNFNRMHQLNRPGQNAPQVIAAQPDRMPVLVPGYRSKMPVYKPDPSVHYFLKIKKIGSADQNKGSN